jgi:hypothetical protein
MSNKQQDNIQTKEEEKDKKETRLQKKEKEKRGQKPSRNNSRTG